MTLWRHEIGRAPRRAGASTSEASDVARIILPLGDETGAYVVTATAPGVAPVTITVAGV
jgi:hypothetical protein